MARTQAARMVDAIGACLGQHTHHRGSLLLDAYEAMTSDRSYRDSIGHTGARAELTRCAGSQSTGAS
jgi:hypothetical protein